MTNANKADAAVLLLRTSCSKQDIDSSMNQQEPPCRNYIRKLGFEKYNVYSIKESSTRGNRPKFHKMLMISRHLVDAQPSSVPLLIACQDASTRFRN